METHHRKQNISFSTNKKNFRKMTKWRQNVRFSPELSKTWNSNPTLKKDYDNWNRDIVWKHQKFIIYNTSIKVFSQPIKVKSNKTAGQHRHIFRPITKFSIKFCKQLKTENTVLNLVFNNSTTDFYSWHYRLIRAPKQSNKPEVFFWITVWKFETSLWDLYWKSSQYFTENEFDYREKQLQVALLSIAACEITHAGTYFGLCLSSNLIHRQNCPLRLWWKSNR